MTKENSMQMISVLCSMIIILMGSYMLFMGFHNMDLGHNMGRMECWFETSLCDYASDGICHSAEESVAMGVRMLVISPFLLIIGAFLLGYSITGYVEPKKLG